MIFTPLPKYTESHYVYVHTKSDEVGLTADSVFYVGKGTKPKSGKNRAWKENGRSIYWKRVAQKHGRLIWILAQGLTEEQALQKECELIAYFRSMGCRLANMNDGGTGGALTGEPFERMRKSLLKRFQSETARKLVSEATKRGMAKNSVRRRLSEANMGKPRSQEVKDAIRSALKGRKRTERERKALKKSWENPEIFASRLSSLGARQVKCVQTGDVFLSSPRAAAWLRKNGFEKASSPPILRCCKGLNRTAYGYNWVFADC